MAKNVCSTEFAKALSKHVGEKEAEEILEDVLRETKENAAREQKSIQEALLAEKDKINDQIDKNVLQEKLNALQNILTKREIESAISKSKNPLEGMRAYLVGSRRQFEGARNSTELAQSVEVSSISGKFLNTLEKQNLLDAFKDQENHLDIAKEMFGEDSENEKAAKISKVIKDIYDSQIDRLNKNGAEINARNDYIARQTHNPELMLQPSKKLSERFKIRYQLWKENGRDSQKSQKIFTEVAYLRWKNFILPRLSNKTFIDVPNSKREEVLREEYFALAFGRRLPFSGPDLEYDSDGNIINNKKDEKLFKFFGPANLAKKLSQRRILHFKDGKSWYEYSLEYGDRNFPNSIFKTMINSGKSCCSSGKIWNKPKSNV